MVCTEQRNSNTTVSRDHNTHMYEQVFEGFNESLENRLGHKSHEPLTHSTCSTGSHMTQIVATGTYRNVRR